MQGTRPKFCRLAFSLASLYGLQPAELFKEIVGLAYVGEARAVQDADDAQDLAVRMESGQWGGPPRRLRGHEAEVHFARLPWEKLEGALLRLLVEAAQKLQVNLPKQVPALHPRNCSGSKPCGETPDKITISC